MKKRVLAIAATLVTAGPMLGGCALLSPPDLVIYNAQHEELMDEIVPLFEEETGLDVELRNGKDLELANQLVAEFPDDKTAERAEQVLLSWRNDCKRNLKKFDKVDVGDLTEVTTDQGTGNWYLLTYGPAEGDPDSGYFDAQGVVRVGNRVAVLRMALVGQDYNYAEGEEPMVAAVRAAAARL